MAQKSSDVHYAIAPSWQQEYQTIGTPQNTQYAKVRVGYDVHEIIGHIVIGGKVFLRLGPADWIRSLDLLEKK